MENTPQNKPSKVPIFVWFILAGAFILLLGWLIFPVLQQSLMPQSTATPTALPPTVTARPSSTPTQTPLPSLTPTITNTPLPQSAYLVPDSGNILPPVPAPGSEVYILNDDKAVTPQPEYIYPQWYTSEQISQQLAVIIPEPFHATVGYGGATWAMDAPLAPGLYQIFVMDTLYSSSGELDFQVRLGDTVLSPWVGQTHIKYVSVKGEPAQKSDLWRSLGIYAIDQEGIFSVSSVWEARDNSSVVAIDRVAIVHLAESSRTFISALPANLFADTIILDDSAAEITKQQLWYERDESMAWGDRYQVAVNPTEDTKVIWSASDLTSPGTYQVILWIPKVQGDGEAEYKLKMNGDELPGAVVINQGILPGNQWIPLGTWQIYPLNNQPFLLSLEMEVSAGTIGEVAADAVVLIRTQ